MKKDKIIFSIDEFKYPSKEEFKLYSKEFPKIVFFNFAYNSPIAILIKNNKSLEEESLKGNLYWWNHCLINRYWNVHISFISTMTSYYRGFSDDYTTSTKSELINHLLFENNSELFYYYFFSARDIIAQIINIYYNLNQKENHVHFDKNLIKLIPENAVKEAMNKFLIETVIASGIRNGYAHRFTPSINDLRTIFEMKNGKETLSFGGKNSTSSKEIIKNMNQSIESLAKLIKSLKKFIKQSRSKE